MSHHIYHTEGFILGSHSYGEANKYYAILTKDLGLINASAQSVRKLSSKLRFVLTDFSFVKIDLVKGREFWRLTTASKTNKFETITKTHESLKMLSNVSRLLKRLMPEQEKNLPLFEDVLGGISILEKSIEKKENLDNAEMILVLRILYHLGYFSSESKLGHLILSPWESEVLNEVQSHKNLILKEINNALNETQM
ncbi:MAG: DNA repair protein RecO [Patescibacteria group bacterium]